jgi:multiple sugar transport system substrate-binding protein
VRKTLMGIVAVLAFGLAGCGGDDGGGSSSDASGDVSMMVFGDPDEIQGFKNMIAAYENEQPDVNVDLIEAADRDDLIARLSTSFAGGTPPDLFLLNYRYLGQFVSKDVLEPLEERVDDSDVFQQEDFYEEALEAFRFDGALTCVPQNISSLVVYYNKDLFEKAGVAPPEAGWKWDDMVAAAKKLQAADETIDGLGVEPVIIRLAPFIWSNGGELVDDDENPSTFEFDTPEAQNAMADFFELNLVDEVVPSEEEIESEDLETRFINGRLGMLMESRRAVPTLRAGIKDFDWDVAALPQHKQAGSILHSDAYCMTKASENKDAAWSFMEYALGPEGAEIVAKSGRTVPSLKSVAESPAFLDPTAKPANSQVWLDAIPAIKNVPAISTWPEIEDAVEPMLEEALYTGEGLDGLVEEIKKVSDPLFAKAQEDNEDEG